MAASPMRQAPLLPVLGDLQRVGVLEQRLGRNAAPVEAGAAERRRALDDRGPETELRGADGGNVAACARANHDDVVCRFAMAGVTSPSSRIRTDERDERHGRSRGRGGRLGRRRGLSRDRGGRPASGAACSRSAAPSTTGSAPPAAAPVGEPGSSDASAARSARTISAHKTTTDLPYRGPASSVNGAGRARRP